MVPDYAKARQGKRAHYDEETIHAILDTGLVGHVGFVSQERPMVMPMAYARVGSTLYLHGASKTRLMGLDGQKMCVTVTQLTGIVAARSSFHHSVNYRCAVVHGTARKVTDDEHEKALNAITDHLLPGRSGELRAMTPQELKATGVIALDINAASAKIRTGPPVEDADDLPSSLWGGVVPVVTALGTGIQDAHTPEGTLPPPSIRKAQAKFIA
ncbi:pyridoxamine 5'-phosphate oxidase family protein [Asaia krungthepensis]|uniref:Flavin-nucleotide-binding protein n=1 Tax=Asaia krungthepensis NRIC 0535 TaxID=1307925 RepID=A0ABQ0Q679_9PROT|nr:pyridoxamine 5'-phosphate oxidase family protein [Asaia krungthepensis]GBQ93240.1 putative flavin-nucleotide-binding protein [Asaia krungthepensis NRIC 0535]